ncbi:hypothetical protein D2V17_14315 [Aurantiacibacter xanthus]|uniref:Mor transcription activator domain-containing protein n=1 Tax=Aurantiacibacter xanthus TaxID=1784712 RepID=A0A3A1P5Y9_9SPHN|nr:hypothetical protein [Aurantiacibacter xanthus]RIV82972.1 hypothetical protein D2V17_14315 [Aurantiacibacter xanthus]
MSEQLSHDLIALLGDGAFIALVEAFGGTRVYIPVTPDADHEIAAAIGTDMAHRLGQRYAPAVLRIPLARAFRARHYRAKGLSNAQIARALGITESGVDKLFARMDDKPVKGSAQLSLDI